MKLVIVLAVVICTYAAKLDRTYLPPPGAASAGGSPGSLSTPNRPGSSFDQSGKPTIGRDNFGINDGSASINDGSVTSYSHGPQGGSNINVQTPTASDFRTPAAGNGGHSSQHSQNSHSVDGSVTPAFGNDQATFDNHDESNQNYDNQDLNQPERPQAAADRAAETTRYDSEIDGDSFAYSFETSNGISAEEKGVATNGVQAQGGFSYTGDDGQQYKVTYTANENGYLPQGDHLPTPPPIPDEILRSIEENAKAAAAGTQEGAYHEDDTSTAGNGPAEELIQYQTNAQNIPNAQTGQLGQEFSQSDIQNQNIPSSLGSTPTTGLDNLQTSTRPSVFGQSQIPQSSLSNQQNVESYTQSIGQQQIPTFNQQSSQSGYNYNRPAASQSFSRPSQTKDVPDRSQQNDFGTSSPGNEIYQYNTPKPQSQYRGPESQTSQQITSNYQNSHDQRPQSQIPQYSAPKSQVPQYTTSQPQAQNSQFTNFQSQDSKYTAPKPQTTQIIQSRPQGSQIAQTIQPQSPQYTAQKVQFTQNQGSNYQTPQYTAPKYQSNQNIPQSQSPKYTAPSQQTPQFSASNDQSTQFHATQPQSPQSFRPQNLQYNAPQAQSPKYTAPKQQRPKYSAPNVQNGQSNNAQPQSPQYSLSRPQNYNAPQPQSPKYEAPKQTLQYSAPNIQNTQFNAPNTKSPQYSPSRPQNPQYNAPQGQSPQYKAPKPQYLQSGPSRPQKTQYNQQQSQSTQFVPTKPQLTQQYASNKGYQYEAPTGQTFDESRPGFNNQSPNLNSPFGSQNQKFNNGFASSSQKSSGSLGSGTAKFQPTTTSPSFVPLGQKTQTPGEDFSGPRQPPSFSPEEGYRY